MKDDLGFTPMNFSHLIHSGDRETDKPFVFAGQAQQVIFIQDLEYHKWFVRRSIKLRDIFDMGEENSMSFDLSMQSDTTDLTILENICDLEYDDSDWATDGIESTRAKVYILTHTKHNDGRPLDKESTNTVDKMKEKLSNGETPIEQLHGSVAWEEDVYSQVLKNDKSGYIHGLGLGPTPSLLWGTKSSSRNVSFDGLSNEVAHKLEQQINESKELNKNKINN
ncbi:hypothetical protein HAX54_009179 [Datura stramonium]|uniref:CRIB domain-containing protein n=1 Tax=Datura stramonium TaxID=4076 RepID=A0ABS8TEH2_DATST|nr:hypothetical protein [Datura stramonium]